MCDSQRLLTIFEVAFQTQSRLSISISSLALIAHFKPITIYLFTWRPDELEQGLNADYAGLMPDCAPNCFET
jgi:hypothetical protein